MTTFIRTCNALLIFVIIAVISTAIYFQFGSEGLPCPYCWLQRMGMIGMCTAILYNLRFGISLKAYAIALFFAFIGGAVALRQITFHICPNFPIFGHPILGYNLYSWSFIVFCCSSAAIFIFLFFHNREMEKPKMMNLFERLALILLVLLTIIDCALIYKQCGFGRCKDVSWPQPALRESR